MKYLITASLFLFGSEVLSLLALSLYLLRSRSRRAGTDRADSRCAIAGDLLRIGVPVTVIPYNVGSADHAFV